MWLSVCCNLLCFRGGVIMTLTDPHVREAFANMATTWARQRHIEARAIDKSVIEWKRREAMKQLQLSDLEE